MNAIDSLLEWASELGSGSWRVWREACDFLQVESTVAARNLSALGHLEFDWIGDRFAAAPPTAALALHSSGCLLLTGARRRGARDQLIGLYEQGGYDIDLRPAVPQESGPETWLIESELDEIEQFCLDAGLALEIDSGRRIAAAVPRAALAVCAEEGRPDPRFARKWVNTSLESTPNVSASTDGLWWVEEYRRDVAFIRREGTWFRVPTREYGPYLAYPEHSFITYNAATASLTVDNEAPLPPLLARAGTLQSGRLPQHNGAGGHTYANIDEELAELIQEKLDAFVTWE